MLCARKRQHIMKCMRSLLFLAYFFAWNMKKILVNTQNKEFLICGVVLLCEKCYISLKKAHMQVSDLLVTRSLHNVSTKVTHKSACLLGQCPHPTRRGGQQRACISHDPERIITHDDPWWDNWFESTSRRQCPSQPTDNTILVSHTRDSQVPPLPSVPDKEQALAEGAFTFLDVELNLQAGETHFPPLTFS